MVELRNRTIFAEDGWRLPLVPPDGIGIVVRSCRDRGVKMPVPARVGIGLRIGGEASLCFECGPDGGVYHPADGLSMEQVRTIADGLPFVAGYER
jgi:hypothetical protein